MHTGIDGMRGFLLFGSKDIFTNCNLLVTELESQHFPVTVTISLEQGANDVTRGPLPLITGNRPVFAGILKDVRFCFLESF